jgi:DNA repair exonuclease SbcCD nuclease subunit
VVSVALVLTLLHSPTFARSQKWCFVVAGDGRSDPKAKRPEDKDGVNALITHAVVSEKAKFLMWTGDLVYGYTKTADEFETMLKTWRNLMKPVYDKKIPVLACRGNHEAGAKDSEAIWNKVFSGSYSMPGNGPKTEKNLSYFYGKGDVLAIGLDQYTFGNEEVNQPWLNQVLAVHKKPFIFAMGHEPAFMDGSHKDTMDIDPAKRDAFWGSLITAGARVFFCGHDHLYDHMMVTKMGDTPGPEVHQFVAGTAGAPFYKQGDYSGNNVGWILKRLKHIDNTYGYLVVTIEGKKATITFKGRTAPGKYKEMDTFSYMAK